MSDPGTRIALYQGPAEPGSVARNLDLLEARAAEAAGRGARLLICPEMFLSGYNIGAREAARLAEPADGPALARAAGFARANGIALLLGYPERGMRWSDLQRRAADRTGRPQSGELPQVPPVRRLGP